MDVSPRFLTLFGIPIAAFAVWGCGSAPSADKGDDKPEAAALVETAPVTVRPIEVSITAQGTFVAAQGSSMKVGAITAGRIASVLVKEGDSVKQGQLVALLDSRPQAAQAQSASAALSVAQIQAKESALTAKAAELDQESNARIAGLALETAKSERDSATRLAELDLQTANVELKKTLAGNRPQEVIQAEAAARQAQVARDAAQREERRNQLLLEHGIVSQKAYDESRSALIAAEASLRSAQAEASLMREGSRKEDIEAARLHVQSATQTLQSARQVNDQKVLQAETALKQAKQAVLAVQAKKQEVEANNRAVIQKAADAGVASATQSQFEVRAPIDGRVVHRYLNEGDTPDNNSPILEIVSKAGGLEFVAGLALADSTKVKVGMPVSMAPAGDATGPISGTVISVGEVDPQTGLMGVRVKSPNPPKWLQPGAFASAKIVIAVHKAALAVPKSAVLNRDGDSVVFLVKGEKAAQIKVKVGAEQDGFVEILSGLEKGQSVITVGNYELSDGDGIKVGSPDDKKADDSPAGAKDP